MAHQKNVSNLYIAHTTRSSSSSSPSSSSSSLKKILCYSSLCITLCTAIVSTTTTMGSALHLTGVTLVPNHPRGNVWSSFFHELIAELAEIGEFTYNLRTMPQSTKYGGAIGEVKPEGLIGEVYYNRADFVIADIEITTEREAFIEFTRPFMRAKLAALISNRRHQTTLSSSSSSSSPDSDNTNRENDDNVTTLRELLQRKSERAVIRATAVERYIRTSKNPLVYQLLPSYFENYTTGLAALANNSDRYVLITDSARGQLMLSHDCSLNMRIPNVTVSSEIGTDFEIKFAIGFQHDSPFVHHIDLALQQLENSGKLAALIEQHWTNYCKLDESNEDTKTNSENPDINGSFNRHIINVNKWTVLLTPCLMATFMMGIVACQL